MDDLKRMVIFAHVVDAGSFTGAAQQLAIAKSAVSKHISVLEKNVGTQLINRTTRGLSLTEEGAQYYQLCQRLLACAEEARHLASAMREAPYGTLKVATPASFGAQFIAPLLHDFLQQYPALNAQLLLDDQVQDMVKEGIDVSLRVGWLPDSSFRARKLGNAKRILCAAPEYLAKSGVPQTPQELAHHEWIILTLLPTPYRCTLSKLKQKHTLQLKGRIKTNNGNAVRALLLAGAGVAGLSDFLVAQDIREGRLVQLLPEYDISDAGIYAVYQDQRQLPAKIRCFIDYLSLHLKLPVQELGKPN